MLPWICLDFIPCIAYVHSVRNLPTTQEMWNAGDADSIPGLRRYPGEGNGHPLQYSCLENSTDRGAWRATVDTTEWLTQAHTPTYSITL